jgi:phosphatidylserine/phosphatidylglycerophosphate/cardiolipin synthase-like enzyme
MLEWLLIGTGFTGALTLVWVIRALCGHFSTSLSVLPHFSPKGGCADAIVRELGKAHREILVQAYSFTCPSIGAALVAARVRGVAVEIVLDRANEKDSRSELGPIEKQGVEVLIDSQHAIAHNKIIIIDRHTLITGSFNFTRQAENENAENLVIITGSPTLLDAYVKNFMAHKAHSQAPGAAAPKNAETPKHGESSAAPATTDHHHAAARKAA